MDTGQGHFVTADTVEALKKMRENLPDAGGTFHVGEEVKLKGSLFRVRMIKKKELRLELLKRS